MKNRCGIVTGIALFVFGCGEATITKPPVSEPLEAPRKSLAPASSRPNVAAFPVAPVSPPGPTQGGSSPSSSSGNEGMPTPSDVAAIRAELQSLVAKKYSGIPTNERKYPTIDARLRKLLGSSYATLEGHTVGVPVRQEDNFVIATACRPHQCGAGIIVIFDLATGAIHCGMDADDNVQIFSEEPRRTPSLLTEWKNDHPIR